MGDLEQPVRRGDVARLIAQVGRERGIDLAHYRLSYVERRLAVRLRALGLATYHQYGIYLSEHPEEYTALLDAVTINVTEFFRDPTVWKDLRERVIPELLAEKQEGGRHVVRAWSAGCATGEEAYSLAMALASASARHDPPVPFSVLGTDLDPVALQAAEAGRYELARAGGIHAADRMRYTDLDGAHLTIRPEIRDRVRFRRLDLFTDEPPHALDLICCRNVFIYFAREEQERLIRRFLGALTRGGCLVIGQTETMPASLAGSFETISARERVYRKR